MNQHKNPEGYSPFRVLVDWYEIKRYGNEVGNTIPEGTGSDGECVPVRETRVVHWCMVEGALQREKWTPEREAVLLSLMSSRLDFYGKWWLEDRRPPTVAEAVRMIETDVHEFYRYKKLGIKP